MPANLIAFSFAKCISRVLSPLSKENIKKGHQRVYYLQLFIFSIGLFATNEAFPFGNDDLERIKNTLSLTVAPPPPSSNKAGLLVPSLQTLQLGTIELPGTPSPNNTQDEIVNKLDDAYIDTLKGCEGRFDLLANLNNQLIKRSEWIAIVGGVLGVIGTIATCPHCAAAMSGLAGIANPLQATFAQNNDTPQTTQARLSGLAKKINEEFDNYKKLEGPNPADDNRKFYSAYRLKKEQLLSIATSCLTYSNTYAPASAGQQSGK